MKAKFFTRFLAGTVFLVIFNIQIVYSYEHPERIPDDVRPKTKDYYTYCMSHRDYGIDIYELNEHIFVSDLDENEYQVEVKPSCNFSRRLNDTDIRGVVIHYTNGSSQSAYSWWQNQYPGTFAHYIINRDGSIIQSVPEIYAAHHIGCYWSDEFCRNCPDKLCSNKGYFYDPEETTIAIELENAGPVFSEDDWYTDIFHNSIPGDAEIFIYEGSDPIYQASRYYESFSEIQLAVLGKLLSDLEHRYGNLIILGHSDIHRISVDPGPAFPKTKFFSNGTFEN
ncbi:MAG: N-acetylmuramoyl-L-alanine amidase [Anaerolineaceae bacterium]|nr:N-acetylmuramoyl-L-alanine amidase [Anaerolineaceae bacterium]